MNRYWVGGSGNYSDTSHWSSSSGGASGASVPISSDNVFIDGNSGLGTITMDGGFDCLDFDCTISTMSTLTTSGGTLNIYGNVVLKASMSYTGINGIALQDTSGGKTVMFNGATLNTALSFSGSTGGWTLQDTVTMTDDLNFAGGTINTNNQTINIIGGNFDIFNAPIVNLGNSQITVTKEEGDINVFEIVNTPTINAQNSTITLNGNSSTALFIDIQTDNVTLNNVVLNGLFEIEVNTLSDTGLFINTLTINAGSEILVVDGDSIALKIGTFIAQGTGDNLIRLREFDTSLPNIWGIQVSTSASASFVHVSYSTATGNATPINNLNGIDGGNNTGWIFTQGAFLLNFVQQITETQ